VNRRLRSVKTKTRTGISSGEADHRDTSLRAWFDVVTDNIVREKRLSRRSAKRYISYFDGCWRDGEHMTRREHYAYQLAARAVRDSSDRLLWVMLALTFLVGFIVGYRAGFLRLLG
jgi:hypothetical protein